MLHSTSELHLHPPNDPNPRSFLLSPALADSSRISIERKYLADVFFCVATVSPAPVRRCAQVPELVVAEAEAGKPPSVRELQLRAGVMPSWNMRSKRLRSERVSSECVSIVRGEGDQLDDPELCVSLTGGVRQV